jgi:hypothetical protein
MVDKIKSLRVEIDGLAQLTKGLRPDLKWELDISNIPNGLTLEEFIEIFKTENFSIIDTYKKTGMTQGIREIPQRFKEIEKAVDSLYLAKAWLGKVLGELGTQNPYGSGYKTKDDIVPTQDVNKINVHPLDLKSDKIYSHIEKVDWLRTEIEKLIEKFKDLWFNEFKSFEGILYRIPYQHLSEARFWLGFELERIKNEADNKGNS